MVVPATVRMRSRAGRQSVSAPRAYPPTDLADECRAENSGERRAAFLSNHQESLVFVGQEPQRHDMAALPMF